MVSSQGVCEGVDRIDRHTVSKLKRDREFGVVERIRRLNSGDRTWRLV